MKNFFIKMIAVLALSLIFGVGRQHQALAYPQNAAPSGDLSVSLTTITSPSTEGETYQVKAVVKNEGPAIAAASGAKIVLKLNSYQLDGINLAGLAPSGWACTPSYVSNTGLSTLSCEFDGSVAAGEQIEFNLTGKLQNCKNNDPVIGDHSAPVGYFMEGFVGGTSDGTNYVYKDTNFANNPTTIAAQGSEWCNAFVVTPPPSQNTDQGASSQTNSTNSDQNASIKAPSTGFSSLSTSLMMIISGLGLASISVLALNRLRR